MSTQAAENDPRVSPDFTDEEKFIISEYRKEIKERRANPGMPRLNTSEMETRQYLEKKCRALLAKRRKRAALLTRVDKYQKNDIRRKLHDFWRNGEIPTAKKMFSVISKDQHIQTLDCELFHAVMKDMGIEVMKKHRGALLEKEELITWRRNYLDKIKCYRAQNRPIYYLGVTCVKPLNASTREANFGAAREGQMEPSVEGNNIRLVVLHIGSNDGFVPGRLMCFESDFRDHHDEMDADMFHKWFVETLPLLKDNAVIVMDNAPYNCAKKHEIPIRSWKKQAIIDWLESRGEIVTRPVVKIDLMKMVRKIKEQHDLYVVDEYAKDHGKIVLRLPPYHDQLSLLEFVWLDIKRRLHMSESNIVVESVKRSVEETTPVIWMSLDELTKRAERELWDIEGLTDDIMDEQA